MSHLRPPRRFAIRVSMRLFPCLLVMLIAAVLAPASQARAQGAGEFVPDPMSTAEIMDYADWLALSGQQKRALMELHDAYTAQYKALRDGPIKAFIDRMNAMQAETMFPSRRQFESMMQDMDTLQQRVKDVDRAMFDQMQSMLSEEQLAMLPRIRLARERRSLTSLMAMGMPMGSTVELTPMLREQNFTPQQWNDINPLLHTYEIQLTAGMREQVEAVYKMWFGMFDALEAAGYDSESYESAMNDPEAMEAYQKVIMEAWQAQLVAIQAKHMELCELNERTVLTIGQALPRFRGQLLYRQVIGMQYSALYYLDYEDDPITWLEVIDKMPGVTDEQQQAIRGVVEGYLTETEPVIHQVAELAKQTQGMDMMYLYDEEEDPDTQAAMEKIEGLAEQLQEAASRADAQVEEILGDEQMHHLRTAAQYARWGEDVSEYLEMIRTGEAAASDEAAQAAAEAAEAMQQEWYEQMRYSDQFVPARMQRGQLLQLARTLDLDDAQQAILNSIYDEYNDRYQTFAENDIKAIGAAASDMWDYDYETGRMLKGPDKQSLDRVYGLRRAAHAKVLALDDQLFDDCRTFLSSDDAKSALQRLIVERRCDCYDPGNSYGYMYGGPYDESGAVDLKTLFDSDELKDLRNPQVDAALAQYARKRLDLLKQRFEISLDLSEAGELWGAMSQAFYQQFQDEEGGFNPADNDAMVEFHTQREALYGDLQERQQDINRKLNDLSSSTIEALAGHLDDESAALLQRSYRHIAYRSVYMDAYAVDEHLKRAIQLPDLSADLRSKLNELYVHYTSAYASCCDRMIEIADLERPWDYTGEWDEAQMAAYQQAMQTRQTLAHERSELNARTNTELRILLTEEQVQAIGGLPELTDNHDDYYW
jgi:hypothetical protein